MTSDPPSALAEWRGYPQVWQNELVRPAVFPQPSALAQENTTLARQLERADMYIFWDAVPRLVEGSFDAHDAMKVIEEAKDRHASRQPADGTE